ncbi:MAG: hypothetical protein AAFR74_05770 [Pseudomonadota bacterium]
MARKFSFENAAFHFAKTDGDRGFLALYILTYIVLGVLLYVGMAFLMWPFLSDMAGIASVVGPNTSDAEIRRLFAQESGGLAARGILGGIGAFLLYVMFYVSMEAAILRRYIRDEGFSLRFGADEFRLVLVLLLFYLILLGVYFAAGLAIGLLSVLLMQISEVFIYLSPLILLIGVFSTLLYFSIKFAPAAALTIRNREFSFFGAWNVTKGRWWAMFGSYIVLYLILTVSFFVVYLILVFGLVGVLAASGIGDLGAEPAPEEVLAVFFQPATAIVGLLFAIFIASYGAFSQYAWAGIAAIAAKDDPRQGGGPDAASAFD